MPSLDTLLAFLGISVLITLAPGPDNLMVIGQSLAHGRRAGLAFGLGCAAGCVTHIAWATLGIAAVVRTSPGLFLGLKLAGAAWLLWLGIQALRSGGTLAPASGMPKHPWQRDLARGFVANALNPKVALFFLAFVPQFIAPGTAHTGGVFLALGLLFTFNSLLVCIGWALAAAWLARRAGALQRATRWLDGLAGTLFIGFGIRLALTDAPTAR